MIVKVQMPITSSAPNPKALVYDKTRTYMVQMEVTPELEAKMEGSLKRFFQSKLVGDQVELGDPVRWQEW